MQNELTLPYNSTRLVINLRLRIYPQAHYQTFTQFLPKNAVLPPDLAIG